MLNRIRGSLFIEMSHFQAQMIIHSFSWFLQIPIYMFKLLSRQNVRRETIKIFITTLCCLKWFTFVLALYDLSIQHLNEISLASPAKFFIYWCHRKTFFNLFFFLVFLWRLEVKKTKTSTALYDYIFFNHNFVLRILRILPAFPWNNKSIRLVTSLRKSAWEARVRSTMHTHL